MKFIAEIDVMPLKALLDPQGKAVSSSMKNVGLPEITNVRIGKHITWRLRLAMKLRLIKKLIRPVQKCYAIRLWRRINLKLLRLNLSF